MKIIGYNAREAFEARQRDARAALATVDASSSPSAVTQALNAATRALTPEGRRPDWNDDEEIGELIGAWCRSNGVRSEWTSISTSGAWGTACRRLWIGEPARIIEVWTRYNQYESVTSIRARIVDEETGG